MSADTTSSESLVAVAIGNWRRVVRLDGERSFRRRLLEMGVLPGSQIQVVGAAPLGDPLTIETEHGRVSIRRREALAIQVSRS